MIKNINKIAIIGGSETVIKKIGAKPYFNIINYEVLIILKNDLEKIIQSI